MPQTTPAWKSAMASPKPEKTIVPALRMPAPDNRRKVPARNGSNCRKAAASASSAEACPPSNDDGIARRNACPRVDPGFGRDRPEGAAPEPTAELQARNRLARSPQRELFFGRRPAHRVAAS